MGVMATRRIPPQTAVVWEQLRSYGAFTVTMVVVGLVGALALLVNYRLGSVSFRDVLTIYDGYRVLVFVAMALLLSISHNPDNARMAFPLRLFRLPLPTETLAALVLGSRLLLLSALWAALLLFRIVLMEAPDRFGIEGFHLCLGLAWYTGFQSGTWFAAGRNVWLWGAWVVPLGAVAVMILENRSIRGGHFDAPEFCGILVAVLGLLALQAIRAVRFHRCRSLDEEKVGFRDVLRPQHRLRRAQGALVFENPLDAQAWFLRRRYHQGRKWVFAFAALGAVYCKLITHVEGVYLQEVALPLVLIPAGCVFLLALYWQVADAYLGRSGGMTFQLVRPFSSTDCARARLLVASRQVLWDLCVAAGLPLLVMWMVPPLPTILYPAAWPLALAGFHSQFGMSALRAAGLLVLAAWVLRALPPDAAAKAVAAFFGPVIVVALLAVYSLLERAEEDNVWLITMCVVGTLLILLFLRTFWSALRLGLINRWVAGLAAAAALALAGFYYLDVAELLNGASVLDTDDQHWRLWSSTKTAVNPWLANALFMAGLAGLAALPFAAGPLQWRRWRHGAGKDAAGSLSPAGGEGTAEFLRRFLPAPLGLAGVLAVLWVAGAWYHAHRDDYLPRVSGERRSLESLMAEASRVPAEENATPRYREAVRAAVALVQTQFPREGGRSVTEDTLFNVCNLLLLDKGNPRKEDLSPENLVWVRNAMAGLGPVLDTLLAASTLPKATGQWSSPQEGYYGPVRHFETHIEQLAATLFAAEGLLACERGDAQRAARMLEGLLGLARQNPENFAWGQTRLRASFFGMALDLLDRLLAGNVLDSETLSRLDAAWERAYTAPHRSGRLFRFLYEDRCYEWPRWYSHYGDPGFVVQDPVEGYRPDLMERCAAPWYSLTGLAAQQRLAVAGEANAWAHLTRTPEDWERLDVEAPSWLTLSPDHQQWIMLDMDSFRFQGSGYQNIAARTVLARTAIALRLHQTQTGRFPESLKEVMPEKKRKDPWYRQATLTDRLRYVPIGGGCLLEYSTSSGNVWDYSRGWRDWSYFTTSPRLILQPEPWQAARQ
ncbi:MAG: hypothetical protein GXY15_02195 [Candidatus Hydrogenedentes bacterium]|nr:hypothetical protein [Candidatus Hydrogenedentota bacterium]